ncbi:DCC1-like thiol-disulfide oxidoreductase family protein [Streptomyces sp. NPDC008150]|uniref:thiol-disulfide oxidoreductase DCC family protein n=1 Tax=Streptomyces sp. NPDC008150 TaxID=3364816 RepID=UPI0036E124C5
MLNQPVLVYDGDCAFCTTSVNFVTRRLRPNCAVTAWQFADLASLGVTQPRAEREVLWISPQGTVHGGAQAVAKLLLRSGGSWAWLGGLLELPPARWFAHGIYRLVATNRARLPGGSPACALPADRGPGARTPQGR